MGLLESAILSLCVGSTGQANQACTNAIKAGSKQSGFEQMTESYEQHQTKQFEYGAYSVMGKNNAQIAGGTLWLANAAVTKKASLGLPTLGLCDKLSVEANHSESKLVFRWFW